MSDNYRGYKIRFEIRFENGGDLTAYNVYQQASTEGSKDMLLIASGSTAADLAIANIMTIAAAGWSGVAVLSDFIVIITESHVSNAQGDRAINDVEAGIDQKLREEGITVVAEGAIPAALYFVLNPPVPRQIKIATAHISAFRLMNNVFEAAKSIVPVSGKEEERNNKDYIMAYQWLKVGNRALWDWIKTYKVLNAGNAPRWSAQRPAQQSVGVYGQLHGILDQEVDGDYTLPDAEIDPFASVEILLEPPS